MSSKKQFVGRVASMVALAATAACGATTDLTSPPPAARSALAVRGDSGSYAVRLLPTLGGAARGTAINARDWVAGFSDLADGQTRHAALWRDGAVTDLGTLGGPHSSVQWPGLSNSGWVAGIAETGAIDPLGEDWSCSAFFPTVTRHVCRGFVWRDGELRALPTFGGTNGFVTEVNDLGEVVGWAETPVHDPTCNAPQVLQFRAAVWDAHHGTMRQLRPLPGDSTSAATAINDRGQAVGISGDCDVAVGEFSANHAVFWDAKGRPTPLPTLGGEAWHTPMDINARGDVVGFSNPTGITGGDFLPHAFFWKPSEPSQITDIGVVDDDAYSEALGVNNRDQVVGVSCGATCRGFLYEDGMLHDLNALVSPSDSIVILSARHINDGGVITGHALDLRTGTVVPFVATPRDGR
jgi:probable HAF family extracellular repeat protein